METDYIRQGETVQAARELSWARIKLSAVRPQTLVFKINDLLPAFARRFGWGV